MSRSKKDNSKLVQVEAAHALTVTQLNIRLWISLLGVVVLVFGVGGWASLAPISGAVVGSGTLVVDSSVKRVQHAHGGIVTKILVSNGDVVEAGQVVLKLDDTQLRAGLGIITSQLMQLRGRRARLEATRDGLDEVQFPAGFSQLGFEAEKIMRAERRLYLALVTSLKGHKAQLGERIEQLKREIEGLKAQRDAKARELELIGVEEKRISKMFERKLIPVTRLLNIQRDVTRIAGEHGSLIARVASLSGQINETRLKILSLDDDARSNSQQELRDVDARISEYQERRIAAEDQLRKVDIIAPQNGVIHELGVHTVGGVIKAAETVMLVVPQGDTLRIDARIAREDIDQVSRGQVAKLRFVSFNQRTTPEVDGRVLRISPDIKLDQRTGATYYVARIGLEKGTARKLQGLTLIPGMPVEVFIKTRPRTLISYLFKPVSDNFNRAFLEE